MVLSANQNGEMKLSVETDMAAVTTHFKDLLNPSTLDQVPSSHDSSQARNFHEFSKARIDIRKFAQFLSGQLVSPTKVICNIVHNKVVHFLLLNEDVSLQYFMPVVASWKGDNPKCIVTVWKGDNPKCIVTVWKGDNPNCIVTVWKGDSHKCIVTVWKGNNHKCHVNV